MWVCVYRGAVLWPGPSVFIIWRSPVILQSCRGTAGHNSTAALCKQQRSRQRQPWLAGWWQCTFLCGRSWGRCHNLLSLWQPNWLPGPVQPSWRLLLQRFVFYPTRYFSHGMKSSCDTNANCWTLLPLCAKMSTKIPLWIGERCNHQSYTTLTERHDISTCPL